MRKLRTPTRGWAKVTLGVSLLFAVGAFGYFALAGAPVNGAILGAIIVVAGVWEYRRKLRDEIVAEKFEAEAEQNRRRGRQ
ncbi:hypothetical protein [Candidatus Halobonum tyrrellensis]|uniref:Uncharacterized protein n=1 Tax=Candidatus Halobonum tyrrellensis G22 TaxID=1324957 RepID=V4HEG0_9EURY|nr:hypothetical protein [Candidatus Halobonum tyrrellensis]ESP88468.1 hypothetical protein K933_08412 [Candidatus Halobonum tyrrellensis G22]